jgi:hypothetical protein
MRTSDLNLGFCVSLLILFFGLALEYSRDFILNQACGQCDSIRICGEFECSAGKEGWKKKRRE